MTSNPSRATDPSAPESAHARDLPRWIETFVRLLDDRFTIPGTQLRFGLDALLGLVPGVGDATSAVSSASLFWLAVQRDVPRVVIARMALNVAIDALVGAIPVVGDAFDFYWKANRRNLSLLARYQDPKAVRRARPSDYILLGLVAMLLLSALLLPFVVAGTLLGYVWSHSVGPNG